MISNDNIQKQIDELESQMSDPFFWDDKQKAQSIIKELSVLKSKALGVSKFDKGDAIITIFSGAGGDDAEDFSKILFEMYQKFIEKSGFETKILHENKNTQGGYRNITFLVSGKGVYGILKNESGVHRLVRVSPFNAKKLRHTSFSMVEVIPKILKGEMEDIPASEIKIEFSKSSGPGGQNVNKRETAVRVVHIPTNIAVHVDGERTQELNKESALNILKAKLFKLKGEKEEALEDSMKVSKTTDIEWGNQIRSYVLHPYKMIKDHRTGAETSDVDSVLNNGKLELFLEAEKNL
ncbi:MAG: PCRF domain-containing protein [Candidatus Paceibacterota bacterium]|jgi:peptide chain release factor 2